MAERVADVIKSLNDPVSRFLPAWKDHRVYVYRTAETGNEVLWGELTDRTLGPLTPVLQEIPAAPGLCAGAFDGEDAWATPSTRT